MENRKLVVSPKRYKGESLVVSIRMPKALIEKIDKVSEESGRTRSEIFVLCLDYAIDNLIIEDK